MYFYDTNALLELQDKIFDEFFYISQQSLMELEEIKVNRNKDEDIKCKARHIARSLWNNKDKYDTVFLTDDVINTLTNSDIANTPDNIIVLSAYFVKTQIDKAVKDKDTNVKFIFVTDDINCALTANKLFGLETRTVAEVQIGTEQELYRGYKSVTLNEEDLAKLYDKDNTENICDLLTNEYALICSIDGEIIDKVRWNGERCVPIVYKSINNNFLGKVKPRNIQQELAFDLIQNNNITVKLLTGGFGTGKDFVMISNAIQMLKDNKIEKVIWIRNNIEVKNTKPLGALPGDMFQKLLPFAMPLADHLGGTAGLEMFINQGKVEVQHLGMIRGRDIKNSIIYCSESENMTKEHIQLLLGRVGEGSSLWLNGDFKQTDMKIFEENSGLKCLIDKLQGNELFGMVRLDKIERSKTAQLADILG